MSNDKSARPYGIGYGKPPSGSRFKPGQSGNRKGRPKGSTNFASDIQRELNTSVVISENGRRRKITKRRAVAKQLVNKAAGGDPRSVPVLLNESRHHEAQTAATASADALSQAEDQLVMASTIRRILDANQSDRLLLTDQTVNPVATSTAEEQL